MRNPATTKIPENDIEISTYTASGGLIDRALIDATPPLNAGPLNIIAASRSVLTVS